MSNDLCRYDQHTRTASFKVWQRTGLSGDDPPRAVLYEGPEWAMAADAVTRATLAIEDGLK